MRHQPANHGADGYRRRHRHTTGAQINKFAHFGLTAQPAARVQAPLIAECHANFECRLTDGALIQKYNFFIFKVIKRMWPNRQSTRKPCITPATACS
jgi:flavin reductase (DIM6/NTAB) family NADH-FMN oxidoreductase RutF